MIVYIEGILRMIKKIMALMLAAAIVIIIRLIRPFYLVRMKEMVSSRLGHFAADTELYLCENDFGINAPTKRYVDIFYCQEKICNDQLLIMWKRALIILPRWLMLPICTINRYIPGWRMHCVGNNTQYDRDVRNLYEKTKAHLEFSENEERLGGLLLNQIGVPKGAKYVCIISRDAAYLRFEFPKLDSSYHNYRNANIMNCMMAAEALTKRGYYVIRMGSKVEVPFKSTNNKIIDYACSGYRSDFMDVFLGANCDLCITVGTGFDAIPMIFRKPILQINSVPIAYMLTWCKDSVLLPKHHIDIKTGEKLKLSEIFASGVSHALTSKEFQDNDIELVENTS